MFGRHRISLDTSLLERVSDTSEVSLGTYPEAVLAVTGGDSLESVSRHPDSPSPFARLDDQARNAAMQAALDGLIADGTVGLAAGTTVKTAVAAGQAGKLPVTGELGELCRLVRGLRRFQSAVIVDLEVPEGCEVTEVPPPGAEFGYTVPFGAAASAILLVERPDFKAGTRSYTLRTMRAEISRIADFLFRDAPAGSAPAWEQPLHAAVRVVLRGKGGVVTADHSFTRSQGEDQAAGTMIVGGATGFGAIPKKQIDDMRLSRAKFVDFMVTQFVSGTARMMAQGPPRWSRV
jgi:hypothetical protein